MRIIINDSGCWVCGNKNKTTEHHVIPLHIKPVMNMTVPLCGKCHKKVNQNDIAGLYAYAYKMDKVLESSLNTVRRFITQVEKSIEERRKRKDEN